MLCGGYLVRSRLKSWTGSCSGVCASACTATASTVRTTSFRDTGAGADLPAALRDEQIGVDVAAEEPLGPEALRRVPVGRGMQRAVDVEHHQAPAAR